MTEERKATVSPCAIAPPSRRRGRRNRAIGDFHKMCPLRGYVCGSAAAGLAGEHDRRVAQVGRAFKLAIAELRRETKRGKVLGIDDAGGMPRSEICIAPGQRRP